MLRCGPCSGLYHGILRTATDALKEELDSYRSLQAPVKHGLLLSQTFTQFSEEALAKFTFLHDLVSDDGHGIKRFFHFAIGFFSKR